MIQRIQTIYLLAVTILTALMFYFPFVLALEEDVLCEFSFSGLKVVNGEFISPVYPLFGIILTALLVAFVSIFFYKKRMLQIRMNIFNLILFFFVYLVGGVYFFIFKNEFMLSEISIEFAAILPAINIILTYLAIRSIGADEALVKSLDRLR